MTTVIFSLGQHPWLQQLPDYWVLGRYESHLFPDRERFLRILTPVHNTHCLVFCNLVDPDPQLWPLLQLAATLRDGGALSVGLVTPYLPYMMQDTAFVSGEAFSAKYFARILSEAVDWIVTVNPHLHRINQLNEVFSIPSVVVSAADSIGEWITQSVERPFIVGANQVSSNLVSLVAEHVGCPWETLQPTKGMEGEARLCDVDASVWSTRQVVIVDDIMSTGESMLGAARFLGDEGARNVVCVGVHALLKPADHQHLLDEPVVQSVVSVDTISHSSNQIRLGAQVWDCVSEITDSTLEFV